MDEKKLTLSASELEEVVGGVTMNDLNKDYARRHPALRATAGKDPQAKMAFAPVGASMDAIPLACPKCGAQILVDGKSHKVTCQACGEVIMIAG